MEPQSFQNKEVFCKDTSLFFLDIVTTFILCFPDKKRYKQWLRAAKHQYPGDQIFVDMFMILALLKLKQLRWTP